MSTLVTGLVLLFFVGLAAGVAAWLRRASPWLRGWFGPLLVSLTGLAGALLHNAAVRVFEVEEPILFLLSLLAFLVAPILLAWRVMDTIRDAADASRPNP